MGLFTAFCHEFYFTLYVYWNIKHFSILQFTILYLCHIYCLLTWSDIILTYNVIYFINPKQKKQKQK